jgi:hypothetical protein
VKRKRKATAEKIGESIRPDQRIVTRLPLTELWDTQGRLGLRRMRPLGREQIADLLREGPVRFVRANSGLPLEWIPAEDCYSFWKEEVKAHLVEPEGEKRIYLDDFPGEYCYIAEEWGEGELDRVVVLRTLH